MRIDELTLSNFRCFEQATFTFHPEFNVIVGENGSGKTAALDALAIASSSWLRGMGDTSRRTVDVGYKSEHDDWGSGAKRFLEHDIRFLERGAFSFEPQLPALIHGHWAVAGEHAPSSAEKHLDQDPYRRDPLASIAAATYTKVVAGEVVDLPIVAAYGIHRNAARLPESAPEDLAASREETARSYGYAGCTAATIPHQNLIRWIEREERIAWVEKRDSPLYEAVKRAACQMLPNAVDVYYDPRRIELFVRFEDGSAQPWSNLSAGQRNLFALTLDIAMRMCRLNPHLEARAIELTPGVVLIDELDLHLHPRWQRRVVHDLRRTFPKVQFITTTHSPQIISEVEPECLIYLRHDGERIVPERGRQSYGLDANTVLRLMGATERPERSRALIERVEAQIDAGEFDAARATLAELRTLLRGDDPETVGLEASLSTLAALAE